MYLITSFGARCSLLLLFLMTRYQKHLSGSLLQVMPKVRLRGGARANQGRVEVFHNGHWGTVCSQSFYAQAANVICRELGYGTASGVHTDTPYGQGASYIWLEYVQCRGTEGSVMDCDTKFKRHPTQFRHTSCGHDKDASVTCRAPRVVVKV